MHYVVCVRFSVDSEASILLYKTVNKTKNYIRFYFRNVLNFFVFGLVAILASSSDSDSGGLSPPPVKKQRLSAAAMQANATSAGPGSTAAVHNGDTVLNSNGANMASEPVSNGEAARAAGPSSSDGIARNPRAKQLSQCDRDIVRLIGQHLKELGLK